MSDVFAALDAQLRPLLAKYNFASADLGHPIAEEGAEKIRILEYRSVPKDRPTLHLDVCQVTFAGTITAELWSPADLLQVSGDTTVNDVAMKRQVWSCAPARDPMKLVAEIVTTIITWCDERHRSGHEGA
jgi:hypothetical protein